MPEWFFQKIFTEAGVLAAVLIVVVTLLWRENRDLTSKFITLVERNTESNIRLVTVVENLEKTLRK